MQILHGLLLSEQHYLDGSQHKLDSYRDELLRSFDDSRQDLERTDPFGKECIDTLMQREISNKQDDHCEIRLPGMEDNSVGELHPWQWLSETR